MDFPQLTAALNPQRVAYFHGLQARRQDALSEATTLETRRQSNSFATFTPDQISAWKLSLSGYEEAKRSVAEISTQKGRIVNEYTDRLSENSDLKILDKFYASALEKVTEDSLTKLEGSMTKAYEYIYQREKKVKLSMEEFRGKKTIKLSLTLNEDGEDFEEDTDDEGFSAQTTLGSLLLLHFIVSYDLPRIVFFDESLSGFEDGSLNRFLGLLQEFRDTLGFHFVIVTHDRRRMESFADRMYYVTDGTYREMDVPSAVV